MYQSSSYGKAHPHAFGCCLKQLAEMMGLAYLSEGLMKLVLDYVICHMITNAYDADKSKLSV